MVPPVPTPETSTSTCPSVSSQISGPVVCSWMAGIRRVFELVHQNVALGVGGRHLFGFGDGAGHPLGPGGEDQVGAEGLEDLAPLEAHRVGHGQGNGNAAGGGDEGEGDAGVAAGRLDDLLAGGEQPLFLGVPDHGGADAAFYRVGGIASLDLGEDGGPAFGSEAVEADQRSPADGQGVVGKDATHCSLLSSR